MPQETYPFARRDRRSACRCDTAMMLSRFGLRVALACAFTLAPANGLETHLSASWWRDLDDRVSHLHGRGTYSRSELRRLCHIPHSSSPRRWAERACNHLDPTVARESDMRLLLTEKDHSWKESKVMDSWRRLLPLDCEAKDPTHCRLGGDDVSLPKFEELERVPTSEVTLLMRSRSKFEGEDAFEELPWQAHAYPTPWKVLRISLTPNGVRFFSLGAHRDVGTPTHLLGLPEAQLTALEHRLTSAHHAGLGMAPEDTGWGASLLAAAQQHYVSTTGEATAAGGGTHGGPLAAALAAIAVPMHRADGRSIPRASRAASPELKSVVSWLRPQLDALAPAEARALRHALGHARATPAQRRAPAPGPTGGDGLCRTAAECGEAGVPASDARFQPGGPRDGCGPDAPWPQPQDTTHCTHCTRVDPAGDTLTLRNEYKACTNGLPDGPGRSGWVARAQRATTTISGRSPRGPPVRQPPCVSRCAK